MTDDRDDVQKFWEGEEQILPESSEDASENEQNSAKIGLNSPSAGEKAAQPSSNIAGKKVEVESISPVPPWVSSGLLPDDLPVQPLGSVGQKFYFLSARGELVEMAAGTMGHRASLVAMFSGVRDPLKMLAKIAPPKNKRDESFSPAIAGDLLMQACGLLPLFDREMPIRYFGTWRADTAHPLVHLGENIEVGPSEKQQGRKVGRALYPAVPSRSAPSSEAARAIDLQSIADRIGTYWKWDTNNAGALIIGFIGQAVLGQYPEWRSHMYISGKNGTGKSTLLGIISSLLGGMSSGIHNSATAAGVRQSGNRQALAWIFDEAERKGDSNAVEQIIAMFRLMSDQEGAQELRGTSDHSGIKFSLYGAGLLGSIIPAHMDPQDLARFVILAIKDRGAGDSDAALRLADLEEDARTIGPKVWRRMLNLAPSRWDKAFRFYSGMIVKLGARERTGDTLGALLAGWDLMLYDAEVSEDDPRCNLAREIVKPLITLSHETEDMSEGERILRALYGSILHKDHGGVTTVQEEILSMQEAGDQPTIDRNKLLMRFGLRLMPGPIGERPLFVTTAGTALLDKALAGTRWKGSSHKHALMTLDGVDVHKPQKVGGKTMRGVLVPARYLPGFEEKTETNPNTDPQHWS